MSKLTTKGKRYLKDDRWHDENGLLPGHPGLWDPPMTEDEIHIAALSDPDNQPSSPDEPSRARRRNAIGRLRFDLGLTQTAFAERYKIPLGTLRDWEQGRVEPDQTARAYLEVIRKSPEVVAAALKADA
jgi:putative transcriptional regulator